MKKTAVHVSFGVAGDTERAHRAYTGDLAYINSHLDSVYSELAQKGWDLRVVMWKCASGHHHRDAIATRATGGVGRIEKVWELALLPVKILDRLG